MDSLDAAGLLGDRLSFKMIASVTNADDKIKSGTYRFQKGISQARLLDALVEGHSTVRVKVTFPEGVTIKRIASIAQRKAGIDSARIVALAHDRDFLKSIGLTAASAEGYLMPDTYFIYWGGDPKTLLKDMATLFLSYYDDTRKKAVEKHGLTPYEGIILASLVEGEAHAEKDRAIVARLYLNRLKKGMKLQADPTIQYILPDGPRRLFYKDLEIDDPYNTYRFPGLPPTPINSPGRASIEAVIAPDDNDFIYMVAKGDGSGEHAFTKSAAEHERNVAAYRRRVNGRE